MKTLPDSSMEAYAPAGLLISQRVVNSAVVRARIPSMIAVCYLGL